MAELSNSKPQIFADLMTEGLELERACQSVLGRRRAFYSRVEAAGEDRKVFAAVLRIRAKGNSVEHQETQRQIAQRLLWLGMPLGTQAGLFGDLQPPTDAATRTIGLANAKDLGYSAGASNQPPSANPCKPGTELHQCWAKGWSEAQEALANGLKPVRAKAEKATKAPTAKPKAERGGKLQPDTAESVAETVAADDAAEAPIKAKGNKLKIIDAPPADKKPRKPTARGTETRQ